MARLRFCCKLLPQKWGRIMEGKNCSKYFLPRGLLCRSFSIGAVLSFTAFWFIFQSWLLILLKKPQCLQKACCCNDVSIIYSCLKGPIDLNSRKTYSLKHETQHLWAYSFLARWVKSVFLTWPYIFKSTYHTAKQI